MRNNLRGKEILGTEVKEVGKTLQTKVLKAGHVIMNEWKGEWS